MDFQTTYFPNYTIGTDAYTQIPVVCERYGTKAVLIGGVRALKAASAKIRKALEGSSITITGEYNQYCDEASRENMAALAAIKEVQEADMFFVVGGGKATDTGKVLAQESKKPFFTFPTIASNCASCTCLGIVYHPDGTLREYSPQKVPAEWIFIDTQIIAESPIDYLWAGIGDTMAKFYECTISGRGDVLPHSQAMGTQLSHLCQEPLIRYGVQALEESRNNKAGEAIREIALGIIVTTGFVSNLVGIDLNTGLAHACYNGFTAVEGVKANAHLHGEVVFFGIQICLLVDGQDEEYERIYEFGRKMKFPTCLADIHATKDDVDTMIEKGLSGMDVDKWPYKVTPDMIRGAIDKLEEYDAAQKAKESGK